LYFQDTINKRSQILTTTQHKKTFANINKRQ